MEFALLIYLTEMLGKLEIVLTIAAVRCSVFRRRILG